MSRKSAIALQAEEQAIRWLAKLNSPTLTAAEEAEFFTWLESSPLHQAAYVKAEDLWQRGAVLERVAEPVKQKLWQSQSWQSWTVACSCVLAVAVIWFLNAADQSKHYAYHTAVGEQQEVQLEDGSRIILNTNSHIELEFSRHTRTAYLTDGEVFFEVKADSKRPFIIETTFGVVRVVGTRFAVRQSPTDTVVTVIDGKVALCSKPASADQFEPSLTLLANQRSSLQAARVGQTVETLDAGNVLAWRKKQLIFNGQTLHDVIAELNRYFPDTITLQDNGLGKREITAVIQLSDAHTTLQALAQSLDLRVEFDPSGGITLLSDPKFPPHSAPR